MDVDLARGKACDFLTLSYHVPPRNPHFGERKIAAGLWNDREFLFNRGRKAVGLSDVFAVGLIGVHFGEGQFRNR